MSPMRNALWLILCFAGALCACGDDAGGENDAGADASTDGTSGKGGSGGSGGSGGEKDAGQDAATGGTDAGADSGAGADAGADAGTDAGAVVGGKETFKLTAGTLSFDYVTDSGLTLSFQFPASAAGKTITVESVSPKSVTWGNANFKTAFSEVIELGPSGTTFATPVKVTPSDGSMFAFNFSDTESAPEPLALSSDGKSLLLTHFSTLALVMPAELCDSVGGWTDTADVQGCTGATNVFRNFNAKCYRFCYTINAGCCVDPGKTSDPNAGCELNATSLYALYLRSDDNGGQYPYCADGLPTVTDVTGSLVAGAGDQTITLTGTNFSPLGSVAINVDTVIPTTWNSASSATGTVPASALTAAGTLTGIRYINPTWNATGTCTSGSLGNCDFTNGSAALTEPIGSPPGPTCLASGSAASSVTGTGTCADPYVVFLQGSQIDAVVYHDVGMAAGADESVPASPQCSVSATARDVVYKVQVPAGADFDVSVDATASVNPVIFAHEDGACTQPINACADDGASGVCEVVRATHGTTFTGLEPFVTVSEVTDSNTAFTTRFALRGSITTPTLVSITPDPVTNMSGATMTATFTDYTMVNSTGTITKATVFQENVFCDPVSATTCTFTLPNTLTAGVHDISFQFTGLGGAPTTNSVQFTVN